MHHGTTTKRVTYVNNRWSTRYWLACQTYLQKTWFWYAPISDSHDLMIASVRTHWLMARLRTSLLPVGILSQRLVLTYYPMGASLFDILFSFVLEKYIVCSVCGLRSPSFESSSVLYISPTDTSSMQNLILQGLRQKLKKSCSRCNKNTWHVESSYILQPPKYLHLFVNRFRYINKNVIKNRCSIPMDTTVRIGSLKFSLGATIDHHGPSIHSGHYTASINCCEKTIYCNDHTIMEFGIIDGKNSSTAYVILYELIDTWFLDSNRRVWVWSLPWHWHILFIPLTKGWATVAETCGLDDMLPPDDLCSRPEALC